MTDKKPTILCVDDEPKNLELLEALLVPRGYDVITAVNGSEALAKVALYSPDLILLDVTMPGLDGYEVCKKLKSTIETQFLPVVMVTALREEEEKIKGIEAGCDDFISKPFDRHELLARVKSLLRIKSLYDQLKLLNGLLGKLSVTDPLTDLYNRRYLVSRIQVEIKKVHSIKGACSCLIIDVDGFKQINDKHGHSFGDEVLKCLAKLLRESVRTIDVVARYGGDEFFILAPDTDEKNAREIKEKILRKIEEGPFEIGEVNIHVGVSIGISTFYGKESKGEILDAALLGKLMDKLINDADKKLYIAKESKNIVANSKEVENERQINNFSR